ncbi:MAG: hypothetical protein ACW98D_14000 [Promethearchaeota archaeon]|jgi:hypothetical protein
MPKGLLIMGYNNKSGISIKAKYHNEKLNITDGTLMNILSLHEFSKEDGIMSMKVGETNVLTYYSGQDIDYYIVLILDLLEDPEDFEVKLKEISQIILENLGEKKYINKLPSLFNKIS